MLPPLPAVSVSRDTISPISDCIVVRDSDSSSVITEDTGITSMASATITMEHSKESSRAPSVVNSTSSSDAVAPSSVTSVSETDEHAAKPTKEKTTDLPTRVLRQRPGRPSLTPATTPKKLNVQQRPVEAQQENKVPAQDILSSTENRRRSTRLSLLASEIKVQSPKMETPKQSALKRSHEVMVSGSKTVHPKVEKNRNSTSAKKVKVQEVAVESDQSASSSSEDESDESADEENDDTDSEGDDESASENNSDSEDESEKPRPEKPKKVYLKEGLYVGQQVEIDVRPRTKRGRISGFGVQKAQPILPLPMHEGLELLNGQRDFKLPFSIFHVAPFKTHPPNWKALNRSELPCIHPVAICFDIRARCVCR